MTANEMIDANIAEYTAKLAAQAAATAAVKAAKVALEAAEVELKKVAPTWGARHYTDWCNRYRAIQTAVKGGAKPVVVSGKYPGAIVKVTPKRITVLTSEGELTFDKATGKGVGCYDSVDPNDI
jgi:hypothetical protein